MGVIRLLSQEVSQLISAGEVVERPLSVVKELVENAIDAGAKRIEIMIRDGGKSYISVKDDGVGMDREDIEKCLKKYATSKISDKEDLFNIRTLGFRGEALYSISCVSKMSITTKKLDELKGWFLYAEGGEVKELRDSGGQRGTLVEVSDLFYNIPARRKFLKSDNWERTLIIRFIEEISLLYPEIGFILNAEGKDVLILQNVSHILKRVKNLFPDLMDNILWNTKEKDGYRCSVYISKPDIDLSEFYIYAVNGRLVKEKIMGRVVKDIFSEQRKKPPFIFIDLHLPPFDIDVNVHPAKREIKFKNNEKIYNFLRESIEETLKGSIIREIKEESKSVFINEKKEDYSYTPQSLFSESIVSSEEDRFKIIGIFAKCYILIEMNKELFIIDQHAVHERLIYNRLLENEKGNNLSKRLIMPYIFNVTEGIRSHLLGIKEDLQRIGFLFEEIGPRTFALTEVPELLDFDAALSAFSDFLKDEGLLRSKKDVVKELMAISACKEAVKKGDLLERAEIKKVIDDFLDNKIEGFCPHGRNFVIRITLSELEDWFGRKD